MESIFKRASFWNLVTQSGQIALAAAQGITLAADVQHVWNYGLAAVQAGLGILSLWTKDSNNNDVIDIVEGIRTTTVTVTAPKSADVTVSETTETKSDV